MRHPTVGLVLPLFSGTFNKTMPALDAATLKPLPISINATDTWDANMSHLDTYFCNSQTDPHIRDALMLSLFGILFEYRGWRASLPRLCLLTPRFTFFHQQAWTVL